MKITFLDFETSIADLEEKIEQLRGMNNDPNMDISDEIAQLETKSGALTKEVYSKLTPWQIS
ncbi:MAG: acetyl-CoA carboxylase carboxyl transferase subunit alpha, partial [Sideroxydans sp.]|nr:acetyl-CoA carboxylase carboxyl transferase subunit alpha [Sideroxydans sp.]